MVLFKFPALPEIVLAAFPFLYSAWTQSWDILFSYESQITFAQEYFV